ncbi:MAG: ABC-2 type transport system ATP-binding protein [Planctomycetota bacterium]
MDTEVAVSSEVMIQAKGLVKSYGALRAVDDVSFTIKRGEIVGFLGPNGAGKSTTMRMLTGYIEPDAGSIRICGSRMGSGREGLQARGCIGYLPERTPLYKSMRVDRYLAFVAALHGMSPAETRAAFERVVEACDLNGYTARRIQTLSKGYRQRVGLAQALISDPDVLVLDEPTSGLDPAEIVRVRDLITTLAREKTILMSTHVLGEIEEVCPRALMIAAGRIVANGTLAQLTRESGESLRLCMRSSESAELIEAALRELEVVYSVQAEPCPVEIDAATGRARTWFVSVTSCDEAAGEVARLVSDRSWEMIELRHELPTLESVFLERTRGLERSFERKAIREHPAHAHPNPGAAAAVEADAKTRARDDVSGPSAGSTRAANDSGVHPE